LLHPGRALLAAACVGLIAIGQAHAQNICSIPVETPTVPVPDLGDRIVIDAGHVDNNGAGTERYDGFELSFRDGRIVSEQAYRSDDSSSIVLPGATSIQYEGFSVAAASGNFDTETREIRLTGAELNLNQQGMTARGRADDILVTSSDLIELRGLSFTTCPEDHVAWELRGRSLELDRAAGIGVVRGATLRLFNAPIMRAPYFSFPLDDRRKTGFLTPEISERDRTGLDLTVPYYLNLAPNHDLLLEPRLMQDRGAQIAARYRYLLPTSTGDLRTEYINNDSVLNQSRHFVTYGHNSAFGQRFVLDARYENVSDLAYFEDLGDTLGMLSQINLDRFVRLAYYAPRWSLSSRIHEYQTLALDIDPADRPYERMPQMEFAGRWGDRLLSFESLAETVMFDRPIGDTGWRFDSKQELALRFGNAGAWLTPAVGYRQTNYRVDPVPGTPERNYSRGLPVTSIDSGLRFERTLGKERAWIQTLEPRVLYVRVPYENQDELPVFDTIVPDFNLVQLFSKQVFVGPDRIADTNRVSAGMTMRLIDGMSGRERITATIGQTRYRDPRRVTLPEESRIDSTRSNYVAEFAISLSERWNLDLGFQQNADTGETVRARTRLEFRPTPEHLFRVGYRKREDLLEQGDFSMVWPIRDRWRLIGQYSYSLLEKKALERFAGIEYEACCWRLQMTTRRYIVRSTGQTDSTISIKFELKGLANSRSTPEELLGRGILGGTLGQR